METDAEFWLGLIDVGGPQSNGSPFARMLETIDINSEDSEVKLLNWSVELEARAVLDREERRQLHVYLLRKFPVVIPSHLLFRVYPNTVCTNNRSGDDRERIENFIRIFRLPMLLQTR